MRNYFLLFANCIITKGVMRSIIADLQNDRYIFIPNTFVDVLKDLKNITIASFCEKNSDIDIKKLVTELTKLEQAGLGHFTNEKEAFPDINTDFSTPNYIHDCIIELSDKIILHSEKILNDLRDLGCQTVELRCYENFELKKIELFLKNFVSTRIRNVELYLKYDSSIYMKIYNRFLQKYHIVTSLTIHSCQEESLMKYNNRRMRFTSEQLNSKKCCGKVTPDLFKINLQFHLESLKYNTCLNKKISIDAEGNIRNCPSHKSSFGNISEFSLHDTLNKTSFKSLWNAHKGLVVVCQQCEFRNICSDCRVYLENPFDKFSKPLKCGYSPFTAIWEDWATNPSKQKAIEHYELNDIL